MHHYKHIAIIGSGISGLTAAHLLHRRYRITLFEANDYIGGHTHMKFDLNLYNVLPSVKDDG